MILLMVTTFIIGILSGSLIMALCVTLGRERENEER